MTTPFVENQENPMPTVQTSTPNLTFTARGVTVPTVESLVAELALHREAREHEDTEMEWDDELYFYGRPKIVISTVISADEDDDESDPEYGEVVAATYPWDHTVWSLIEAAETARGLNGRVHIAQDVVTFLVEDNDEIEDDGTVFVDDGFHILVADFVPDEARPFLDDAGDAEDESDDEE